MVIFHSLSEAQRCDDGFCAAWVAHHALGGECELVPAVHGTEPPDCTGREVYLVDFSYKRLAMRNILAQARKVTVLDHHESAEKELEGLAEEHARFAYAVGAERRVAKHVEVVFDMKRSGARLAWDHFHRSDWEVPPDLLLRIEDGDLWKFDYGDTKLVQAALRSYPQDLETWDRLMATPIGELAAEGRSIRRFIERKLAELLPNGRWVWVAGIHMPAVNCPPFLASEVAGALAETWAGGVGAAYYDQDKQRVWSLRSRGEGPNVAELARKMGGGGHHGAAGFQVPL